MLFDFVFDFVNDFVNLIAYLIVIILLIEFGIFLFKRSNYKKKVNMIKKFEIKYRLFLGKVWDFCMMLLNMFIAVILAMGTKEIIYKLNLSLGEGYATFGSYVIAICLYLILSNGLTRKRDDKNGIKTKVHKV